LCDFEKTRNFYDALILGKRIKHCDFVSSAKRMSLKLDDVVFLVKCRDCQYTGNHAVWRHLIVIADRHAQELLVTKVIMVTRVCLHFKIFSFCNRWESVCDIVIP